MSKLGNSRGSKLGREARSILEAGRGGDNPTPADRARVKRALMRSIAAGGAVGATSAASSASATQGGAAVASAAAKATSIGLGIKLLGGAVLALTVGTGLLVERASTPEPAHATAAPSAATPEAVSRANVAPAKVTAADPVERPSEPAPGERAPLQAPSARSSARAVAGELVNRPEPVNHAGEQEANPEVPAQVTPPAPGATPALEEDPLAAETRRLREAHGALQAGDPQKALTLLGEQGGQLGEERAAARVLALCQMGRVAEAESARAAFLRDHPRSPLALRIQGGCAPSTPK